MKKKHAIFDIEVIGTKKPVFLCCVHVIETKEQHAFWSHKRGHISAMEALFKRPDLTFVGFNSENFDRPLIAAAIDDWTEESLKELSNTIIRDEMRSWQTYRQFKIPFIEYDHIDLIDVAPGVMISLKTYAGRMGYKTMVDMPFDHTTDLTPKQCQQLEAYCLNDLGVTEALFKQLSTEMELRNEMSAEYDLDLRSKSDAQIAEAILKNKCGIKSGDKSVPSYVTYTPPAWIKTTHAGINEVMELLKNHRFTLNRGNGSPEVPEFLKEPLRINNGFYQMGVGGLHSTHDQNMYLEAGDDLILSDFDVASYYPNIMMKAGLIPRLGGNKGELFLKEYKHIYDARMEAKRSGNKKVANSLKITLNGTFGKLGNLYCSFYSPDLLLAVTITGQLNLLCLIHELEKIKGVIVKSANTDGVLVSYPPATRDRVLKVFSQNAKRTGFEYEETQYIRYAAKDVNNYIAVKKPFDKATGQWLDGVDGIKRKGLYAVAGVQEMKNPTMEVCSNAAATYLAYWENPELFIKRSKNIEDFVTVRNIKGGGVQHKKIILVDDWEELCPGQWIHPHISTKPVKRKSRPAPREVGVGGVSFGRVARWYMTTEKLPALTGMLGEVTGVRNGGTVPKSQGGKLCLALPDKLPPDLDKQWYVNETYAILRDLGLSL